MPSSSGLKWSKAHSCSDRVLHCILFSNTDSWTLASLSSYSPTCQFEYGHLFPAYWGTGTGGGVGNSEKRGKDTCERKQQILGMCKPDVDSLNGPETDKWPMGTRNACT